MCMCNPNTGDPDTGGSLGLADSQPHLIGELRVPVRDCASEKSRCLAFLRVISEADLCPHGILKHTQKEKASEAIRLYNSMTPFY